MQAYRDMDIGTAKPSGATRARIPYRMIDIADPEDALSVQQYQELGRSAVLEASESHGRVIICGGSGLHFRSIVDPMTFAPTDPDTRAALEALDDDEARARLLSVDPEAADHVDLGNPRRVVRALEILDLTGQTPSVRAQSAEAAALRSYTPVIPFVGLGVDAGEAIGARIETRFDAMLDAGLIGEVQTLRGRLGPTARQAVGYKELLAVIDGATTLDDGRAEAVRATQALVKRQRTFFRRDPRIGWLPWQDVDEQRIADALAAIEERTSWTS